MMGYGNQLWWQTQRGSISLLSLNSIICLYKTYIIIHTVNICDCSHSEVAATQYHNIWTSFATEIVSGTGDSPKISAPNKSLHSPSLTWHLKMMASARNLLFQVVISRWNMLNFGRLRHWTHMTLTVSSYSSVFYFFRCNPLSRFKIEPQLAYRSYGTNGTSQWPAKVINLLALRIIIDSPRLVGCLIDGIFLTSDETSQISRNTIKNAIKTHQQGKTRNNYSIVARSHLRFLIMKSKHLDPWIRGCWWSPFGESNRHELKKPTQ